MSGHFEDGRPPFRPTRPTLATTTTRMYLPPRAHCSRDEWLCNSGECIPLRAHCDGNYDCRDYSDERSCRKFMICTFFAFFPIIFGLLWIESFVHSFQCFVFIHHIHTTSTYLMNLHIIWYLDDEGRDCDRNMFRCENGPCINSALRCNGRVDCPYDTSDELDCRKSTHASGWRQLRRVRFKHQHN